MLEELKKNKGITLIELLVVLVISSIFIAAIYRIFTRQQKSYIVQEQVVDMQQNVRVAVNKMMREIRMAGFGNPNIWPFQATGGPFNSIFTPTNNANNVGTNDDQVTIIGAFEQISTLASEASIGTNKIQLQNVSDASQFDTGNRRYICIGGIETNTVANINGDIITLSNNITNRHVTGTPVFKVKAITYRLRMDNDRPTMPVLAREDHTDGGGSIAMAENIENLQFRYTLADGSETDSPANPANIRMVRVTVTARTNIPDPEYRGDPQGFRRRQIASNIQVRNMGISP